MAGKNIAKFLSGLLLVQIFAPAAAAGQSSISGYTEVTSVTSFDRFLTFAPGTHLRVLGPGPHHMGDGTTQSSLQMQGDATISTTGTLTIEAIGRLENGATLRFGLPGDTGIIQVEHFGSLTGPNWPVISVDGGVLEITTASAAAYFDALGPTTVNSGARLDFWFNSPTFRALYGSGEVAGRDLTIKGGVFDGRLSLARNLTIAGDFVLNGEIVGAETISVSSGRSLTITAVNALESSAALVVNGTLDLAAAQSIGSLAGSGAVAIAPGTILTVGSDNISTTYSGLLSGTGSGLTKVGTGALTLAGTGTYDGETRIENGTLAVSGGSAISDQSSVYLLSPATLAVLTDETVGAISGGGAVSLTGNLTAGGNNASTSMWGSLSGSGQLVKTGTGTLVLSGTNTNAGGVAVNQGIVEFAGGQAIADDAMLSVSGGASAQLLSNESVGGISGNGTIALGANTLSLAGAGLSDFGGAITGTGALVQSSSGRLVLSGANTFTGPIQISAGTIEIGNGGTTGSISSGSTITNDATLVVNRSNDLVLTNRIIGSGGIVKEGSGTLTLENNANSYSGGIVIQNGTLAGNTLAIRGDIVNQGTLSILDIGSNTFTGNISGTGNVVVDGAGALTLAGNNTFSGGLTLKNGKAISVAADASLGALPGVLIFEAGTLATTSSFSSGRSMTFGLGNGVFEPANDTRLSLTGTLSGAGGLRKRGPGVLEIAGVGTYSGTSHVDAGTLVINGSIGGPVTVGSGGRLGGNGSIGDMTLNNLATLAPGNSIGTLTVSGDATFGAGSTYEIEANAAGQSDRLVATGTVTIDPAAIVSVAAAPGSYALATTYTVASGASVTGTFAAPISSNLAFLDAALSYDPANVLLTLTRNDVKFEDIAHTPNQAAVGSTIASLPRTSVLANTIAGLSADEARRAYDLVSGEAHAGMRSQLLSDAAILRDAVSSRMATVGNGQAEGETAIWSSALGNLASVTSSPSHPHEQHALTGGLLFGVDTKLDAVTSVGAIAGVSATSFDVPALGSKLTANGVHAGVYGALEGNSLAMRGGALTGLYDISSKRTFDIPGQFSASSAAYTATQAQVFGELALKFLDGPSSAEAYLGLSHVHLASTDFAETGSSLSLDGSASSGTMTTATLGLRSEMRVDIEDLAAKLGLGLAVRSVIGSGEPGYRMQLAGGNAFQISAPAKSGPELVLDLSFDAPVSQTANARFAYQANVGGQGVGQSAKATLSVGF